MSTIAGAGRRRWWRRLRNTAILLVLVGVIAILAGPKVGALLEALTPPTLPEPLAVSAPVWRGDQNWTADQADEFHFKSQGTRTLPIPLSWFLALEEPLGSPLAVPFAKRGLFSDNRYLTRFGFIAAQRSQYNPDGLPIGFAVTPYQSLPGVSQKATAIGLTCAACHTGQLVYGGTRYVIDGGPAATDLGQLTNALGAALGQTAISEKLPFLDGRFERFARAVLGSEYSDGTRNRLAQELDAVIAGLAGLPNGIAVTEGFTRLDALNRIGNQVFALDPHRYGNYVDINAPVNYPHIWTSSWFKWVQYDGSIMQPLIRNAGEAMGVTAEVNFAAPPNHGRFASSIDFDSLHWIEQTLAGPSEPLAVKAFTGLNAPTWPKEFPAIDPAKAAAGAQLYDKYCKGCHLPALTPDIAAGKQPNAPFWTHFEPVTWTRNGAQMTTKEALLKVAIIPQACHTAANPTDDCIATDPAQGMVLTRRLANTAGADLAQAGQFSPGLGIDIDICVPEKKGLDTVHVSDDALQPFPWALGAVVQMAIDEWLRRAKKDDADRDTVEGDRPNCLLAGAGYKARPLNGVWATAPFLHNGSVPTLYDLLSPVEERPKAFLLGNPTFDPVKVGIATVAADPRNGLYDKSGYFILDTSKPGNRNTGHEFSARFTEPRHDGVVGPALSPDDRNAIIEFLKTL
jgi:hypothetical protein